MNNPGVVSGSQPTRHVDSEVADRTQAHGATAKVITQSFTLQ